MTQAGRYVGVGIDTYADHPPLVRAVAEVEAMAERLRPEFDGEPLTDADQAAVDEYLRTLPGSTEAGRLVLLWCGHAVARGNRL